MRAFKRLMRALKRFNVLSMTGLANHNSLAQVFISWIESCSCNHVYLYHYWNDFKAAPKKTQTATEPGRPLQKVLKHIL